MGSCGGAITQTAVDSVIREAAGREKPQVLRKFGELQDPCLSKGCRAMRSAVGGHDIERCELGIGLRPSRRQHSPRTRGLLVPDCSEV